MPPRKKKRKKMSDIATTTTTTTTTTTGKATPKPNPGSQLARIRWGHDLTEQTGSRAAAEMGRRGGPKGGKALAKKRSKKERREAARKAGIASGKARRARGELIRQLREKYGKELAERLAALELEGG